MRVAEVELKHGRVAMLAALGFPIGEQFHPLFGGDIDVPSYIAFQETPLQTFWPAVVTFIAILEVFSVFSFNSPFGGEMWSIRSDYENGDLGFDPLGELRCTLHGDNSVPRNGILLRASAATRLSTTIRGPYSCKYSDQAEQHDTGFFFAQV